MGEHVGPLGGGQAGRQPHEDQPGPGRSPDRDDDVEAVAQAHGHPVAGRQTLLQQALGRPLHQFGQLGVGDVALGGLEGHHVGEQPHGPVEGLDDRAHPVGIAPHLDPQPPLEHQPARVQGSRIQRARIK